MNSLVKPDVATKLRAAIAAFSFEELEWWKDLRRERNVRLDGVSLFEDSIVPLENGRLEAAANLYIQPRNSRGIDAGRSEVLAGTVIFTNDGHEVSIDELQFDTSSILPRPEAK